MQSLSYFCWEGSSKSVLTPFTYLHKHAHLSGTNFCLILSGVIFGTQVHLETARANVEASLLPYSMEQKSKRKLVI